MNITGIGVVVTGGASGLGLATARALSAAGAKVAIFDINEEAGRANAAALNALFVRVGVTDAAEVAAGLDTVERSHGIARILVNCAGIAPAARTVGRENVPHPLDVFTRALSINLAGTFNVLSQFASRVAAIDEIEGERGGDRQHGFSRRVRRADRTSRLCGVKGRRRGDDLADCARPCPAQDPGDGHSTRTFSHPDDGGVHAGGAGRSWRTSPASASAG